MDHPSAAHQASTLSKGYRTRARAACREHTALEALQCARIAHPTRTVLQQLDPARPARPIRGRRRGLVLARRMLDFGVVLELRSPHVAPPARHTQQPPMATASQMERQSVVAQASTLWMESRLYARHASQEPTRTATHPFAVPQTQYFPATARDARRCPATPRQP